MASVLVFTRAAEELRDKEIGRCTQDTGWWETLFLLGGLLGSNRSLETYGQFVQHVLGEGTIGERLYRLLRGTNDQRMFAAIGLLRSVENPPTELANSIMTTFTNLVTMMGCLTAKQFAAAQELGRILGDEAAETFAILFRSPNRIGMEQGAKLLCSIQGKRTNEILLDELRYQVTTEIWVSVGEEAVEPLIAALKDSDDKVRRSAAEALGKIGDSCAVEPLIAALKDSDYEVRWQAREALGKMGDPRAVEPLVVALKDSDYEVHWQAREVLGKIVDPRVLSELVRMAREDNDVEEQEFYFENNRVNSGGFEDEISVVHSDTGTKRARWLHHYCSGAQRLRVTRSHHS
jgi:hypothetical protein